MCINQRPFWNKVYKEDTNENTNITNNGTGSSQWLLPAELPRIHATTPLPCKNLDCQVVHSTLVEFSTVPAKTSPPNLAFKFLNDEASNFCTFSVVPVNGPLNERIFNP